VNSLMKSIRSKFAVENAQVQLSLPVVGVLRDVRSAFFGVCINAGKAVLAAMMESERTALCGPKGVPDAARTVYRGGHAKTSVVLGGRRIAISRPRARAVEAQEISLPTFEWANRADPLNAATLSAIAAGVSTRRYGTTLDPFLGPSAVLDLQERRVAALRGAEHRAAQPVAGPPDPGRVARGDASCRRGLPPAPPSP